MKEHYVSGIIHLEDQGSQNIRTGTHHFGTSRHLTLNFWSTIETSAINVLISHNTCYNFRFESYMKEKIKRYVSEMVL